MRALRIAIVVQGRFHAFDLVRELQRSGQPVTLLTNYPAWAVRRFGCDPTQVRSRWVHGVMSRVCSALPSWASIPSVDVWLARHFGRWAANTLASETWDVVHCWSGVSEELLTSPFVSARCRMLMRGSAHIGVQDRLLAEEAIRASVAVTRPSPAAIERERREYALADCVLVLSTFARNSFVAEGMAPNKLVVLPLGVDVQVFAASDGVRAARCQRLMSGAPIRVLYVGALSARKGIVDLLAVARRLIGELFEFTLVGPMTGEASTLFATAPSNVRHLGKVDQRDLPAVYDRADLFMFPTVEDGFGVVLTQALAASLPVLCTTHCAGPDLITEGRNGWVLPIRSPESFERQLRWCDAHRADVAEMVERMGAFRPSDWADVAKAFRLLCETRIGAERGEEVRA